MVVNRCDPFPDKDQRDVSQMDFLFKHLSLIYRIRNVELVAAETSISIFFLFFVFFFPLFTILLQRYDSWTVPVCIGWPMVKSWSTISKSWECVERKRSPIGKNQITSTY